MRVLSWNVQNLRLRHPGGRSRLDGARDQDDGPEGRALDGADRRLTAAVLARAGADLCLLQEVFDRPSLDWFHDHLLRASGAAPWPWRACLPGNDGAGRDLAVLARRPFAATSHAALREGGRVVFCRDCLQVDLGDLVLFGLHLKAPVPDPEAALVQRQREVAAVRRLIEARFADPAQALWLVLGDFNDPDGRALGPLLAPFGVDLRARMPADERWTWWREGQGRGCPDGMIASPALAARWPRAVPQALRWGMARAAGGGAERLEGVGALRPHASDHAALVLDLPGLGGPGL